MGDFLLPVVFVEGRPFIVDRVADPLVDPAGMVVFRLEGKPSGEGEGAAFLDLPHEMILKERKKVGHVTGDDK